MKKYYLLCIATAAVLFSMHSSAQELTIGWQKSLGGTDHEYPFDIQQTIDGGYIVAGRSGSDDGDVTTNNGGFDFWIVKLDNAHNLQWQVSLGGSGNDEAHAVRQTPDGGYLVAGTTESSNGDVTNFHGGQADYWVVKLSSTGVMEWEKTYGGSGYDLASSLEYGVDGGYILLGTTGSVDGDVTGNHGSYDVWVVKIDSIGTIAWQKAYGGSGHDEGNFIKRSKGGYVIASSCNSSDGNANSNHGAFDYWIINIDATGTIFWQRSFGGLVDDMPFEVQPTADGGFIVVGGSNSIDGDVTNAHGPIGIGDYWIVKLDALGFLQWQKSYGGSAHDIAYSLVQTADGGYIIAGFAMSVNGDVTNLHGAMPGDPDGAEDFWVIRLNASGDLLWEKVFGGTGGEVARKIIQATDKSYILTGKNSSQDGDVIGNHVGSNDFWIVQLVDSCPLPPVPATIHVQGGFFRVCPGDTRTYTTKQIQGVTYNWTVPDGVTINNGQGTNSINVTFDSTFANVDTILVASINSCGSSSPAFIRIDRNNLNPPGTIYITGGGQSVCPGDLRTYSITPATQPGVTYFWTVPVGATILNGQGTTSVDVAYDNNFTTNSFISVAKVNACGMSQPRKLRVLRDFTRPSIPDRISGDNQVCPGDTEIYATDVDNGVVYHWAVSNSATILSGQGTNSITVLFNAGFTGGNVSVYKENNCNISFTRSKNIFRDNNPVVPSVITGQKFGLCGLQDVAYSVIAVPGVTYTWSVTGGGNIVNGQGTNSITVDFPSINFQETVSVIASTNCGSSSARSLILRATPQLPGVINGPTTPCSNSTGNIYTVIPVASATSYTWIAPTGSQITANGITSGNIITTTSNSVSVDFGTVTSSSIIKVRANNSCGSGGVRTLALTPCLIRMSDVAASEIEVYPNPFNDRLILTFSSSYDENYTIVIYDLAGREVRQESFKNDNGTTEHSISTANLASGVYCLSVLSKDRKKLYKIVKR